MLRASRASQFFTDPDIQTATVGFLACLSNSGHYHTHLAPNTTRAAFAADAYYTQTDKQPHTKAKHGTPTGGLCFATGHYDRSRRTHRWSSPRYPGQTAHISRQPCQLIDLNAHEHRD